MGLVADPLGYHIDFVPQPPSSYKDDPSDGTVLCSSIPNSTLVLNEDQAIDGFGVAQPTCPSIHEEYDSELEHPPAAKGHPYLSTPLPFFPDLLGDLALLDFSCVSPSIDAPIVDHL